MKIVQDTQIYLGRKYSSRKHARWLLVITVSLRDLKTYVAVALYSLNPRDNCSIY